jgi:hypothetical protein
MINLAWRTGETADPSAAPDFLWNLVGLAKFMRLSLLKGAHADLSYAVWQEMRVRRDDKGESRRVALWMFFRRWGFDETPT